MIEIRNLTRRYGALTALSGVTADIQRGEVVGLLGHNGAGKTTMMKVLTGYLEPSEGSVRVGGLDVVADRRQVQRRIGYLPENAPLYQEQGVADYLLSMAALRGVPRAARGRAGADAIEAVGLVDRMEQPIGTLSKGLRQRVGLAQAIVHRPDLLILDEPTNGLDPSQIGAIRALVRRLSEHSTVLLSTHILQEVEAVCDRVLVLVGGRLVADGPLRELTRTATLRLSVLGDADVADALEGVAGIDTATPDGPDPELPGFYAWSLSCTDDSELPAPAVARAVQGAGLTLGTLAPARRRLEDAFEDLSRQVTT
ncbi:MAG: ABC transporter ATP-binding protein [Deltaproteobacteria bacterium]|nr:MAG: ABC transporter ATP-binding protein [Deltaproteobacteria bacterium]